MRRLHTLLTALRDRDSGMSLIEVIVAISVLAVLATATLGLYLTSQSTSNSHQNRELAISVANEAMEFAAASSVDTLAKGRWQTTANAQWTATVNPATSQSVVGGISSSYPLADSTANASSVPSIPFTKVPAPVFNGTEFQVQTFVGRCFQPTTSTRATAGECKRTSANPSMTPTPTTTPANMAAMIRVIVVVQWTSDSGCTTSILTNPCKYEVSTLVDPGTPDVEWVTSGTP